jgi:uncharacterized membrane protein
MNALADAKIRSERSAEVPIEPWLLTLIAVVLVGSLYLRFNGLGAKLCWYDEYDTRMRIAGFGGKQLVEFYKASALPIPLENLCSFLHSRKQAEEQLPLGTVLQNDFQICPLYYWTARVWVRLFGDSSLSLRCYSALTSLLAMPLLYLFCLELFGNRRLAYISICLVASSPAFLIYSQEIRHYSLWTATILLSSLALLRAVRLRSWGSWAAYAATLAACLLANALSLLVAAGHGAFVCLRARLRFDSLVRSFSWSLLAASLALVPRVLFSSIDAFTGKGLGWLAVPPKAGLPEYLWSTVIGNWARLFWDSVPWGSDLVDCCLALGLSGLLGISLIYLNRTGSQDQKLFINSLIAASIAGLVLRDLLLLGRSATITRYIFPALIGAELAVAYLFNGKTAHRMDGAPDAGRAFWICTLIVVIIAGLHGSVQVSDAQTHWANWPQVSASVPEVVAAINRSNNPVVLVPFHRSTRMPLVLVERLRAGAGIIPCTSTSRQWHTAMTAALHSGRPVFVWDPQSEMLGELRARTDISVSALELECKVCRLTLRTKASRGLPPKS